MLIWKVKHPSGFIGADLPSQGMFLFHFISFFPYVNCTESAGGLAFSPGDSSDSCFLLMLSLWHSEQRCFKGQRNGVGLREKIGFTLQCVLVSPSYHCSLAQCCSFNTMAVRKVEFLHMGNSATSKLGHLNYTSPSFFQGGGIRRAEQNECLSKPGAHKLVGFQCCCVGPGIHRAWLCACEAVFQSPLVSGGF